ncbi:MAG: superoxide dismutase [Nitrospirales bacterium]|nr:MAG: superoxide dismutase [Nitrospirales bacterium]
MINPTVYKVKSFDLSDLKGISDKSLDMHFKLYQGYVKQTNSLLEQISEILKDGVIDQEENPVYSELTRRLGFEFNGMVLHEYYFENLQKQGTGDPDTQSAFRKAAEESYGKYEVWKTDFMGVAKLRGVGWAICYQNPTNKKLSNHWVSLHEIGNVAGFEPILVLDVWEHAYLFDYAPSDRPKYIEAFFENINWDAVDARLENKQ